MKVRSVAPGPRAMPGSPNREAPGESSDPFKPYRCPFCGKLWVVEERAANCCPELAERGKARIIPFKLSNYKNLTPRQVQEALDYFDKGFGPQVTSERMNIARYADLQNLYNYFRRKMMDRLKLTTVQEWKEWQKDQQCRANLPSDP